MRSHSSSLNPQSFQFRRRFSSYSTYQIHPRFDFASLRPRPSILYRFKLDRSYVRKHGCQLRHSCVQVRAFGEDYGISLDDWSDNEGTSSYMVSSSDGEDSDGEIVLNPVTDIDLPAVSVSSDESLRVTSHRLAMMGRARKRHRIKHGMFINLGLLTFLTVLLFFVDWLCMCPIAQKSENSSNHQDRGSC
ncbi:hypothetical protein LWI29_002702 [Acer saccharum]|uniref:Uncharacterized protein n=1 Tax=Acer saccharum TaxID=4024 RepID=A0AA39VF92_ACESA|nr:hypothetical protein LWI29_002702 [Acer saccharum]